MLALMAVIIPAGGANELFSDEKPSPTTQAESNLEYWLDQAQTVATRPAQSNEPDTGETKAEIKTQSSACFTRDDALPGVIEFSDGRQIAGGIFTTRDQALKVWLGEEKTWQPVPPAAVLSISAVVVQEEMKLRWRWKGMGEPEKVYTGESYPFRRFLWKLHLADDSTIQGEIKGQPLWVETPTETLGPFILSERSPGQVGQTLKDHVFIKKIVISRKMMDKVQQAQSKQ